MSALRTKAQQAEWNRGFWQADADLKTEGDILDLYRDVSPEWVQGYKARVQQETKR